MVIGGRGLCNNDGCCCEPPPSPCLTLLFTGPGSVSRLVSAVVTVGRRFPTVAPTTAAATFVSVECAELAIDCDGIVGLGWVVVDVAVVVVVVVAVATPDPCLDADVPVLALAEESSRGTVSAANGLLLLLLPVLPSLRANTDDVE